jgi:hypothetical protein
MGGGLGTTIGDAGFCFVFVVVVVLDIVAFDLPGVIGFLCVGVAVVVDVAFDLVLVFGVAVCSAV